MNYVAQYPDRIEQINSCESAVEFILDMFKEFNVPLYYDPDAEDKDESGEEDDLFKYCQVRHFTYQFMDLYFLNPLLRCIL